MMCVNKIISNCRKKSSGKTDLTSSASMAYYSNVEAECVGGIYEEIVRYGQVTLETADPAATEECPVSPGPAATLDMSRVNTESGV